MLEYSFEEGVQTLCLCFANEETSRAARKLNKHNVRTCESQHSYLKKSEIVNLLFIIAGNVEFF